MSAHLFPTGRARLFEEAVNRTVAHRNLCLALTSIWWGWGHDQRVSWYAHHPSWPLIIPNHQENPMTKTAQRWSAPVRMDARDLRVGDRVWLDADADGLHQEPPGGPGALIVRLQPRPHAVTVWTDTDLYPTEFMAMCYRNADLDPIVTEAWACPVWARAQVDQHVELTPHDQADAALETLRVAMASMEMPDIRGGEFTAADPLAQLFGTAARLIDHHRAMTARTNGEPDER